MAAYDVNQRAMPVAHGKIRPKPAAISAMPTGSNPPQMADCSQSANWSVPELLSRYGPRKQLQVGV
jgi:hypothetical protein